MAGGGHNFHLRSNLRPVIGGAFLNEDKDSGFRDSGTREVITHVKREAQTTALQGVVDKLS